MFQERRRVRRMTPRAVGRHGIIRVYGPDGTVEIEAEARASGPVSFEKHKGVAMF